MHKRPSISLKDFLVSITKRSCAPHEVNNRVKNDILVPIRVPLSIHALSDGVGSKFCLVVIFKFKNIPSGVKNGVFIGATDEIVITVTLTLQHPYLVPSFGHVATGGAIQHSFLNPLVLEEVSP